MVSKELAGFLCENNIVLDMSLAKFVKLERVLSRRGYLMFW